MKPSTSITQKRQPRVAPRKSLSQQTNFQLEGAWLHLARGVWIAFVLAELVIAIISLFVSRT